ncbi:MAG: DUF166 domain-containing protein [Euryarchaeota archaeon]|nr:DUF166 domain-containing protein [Euryarchaeota archaeon]MBU4138552.1 DUF166 domain-containing protein [Euryarchaeota archaeon]
MISIGVVIRGKYGRRLIENIEHNSDVRVSSIEIPESLPDFIEDPQDFVASLNINRKVLSSDLVITYVLHPDLTPEIIRLAGESGASTVIIAGGMSRAGGREELESLSLKYNMHFEVHEICCEIEKCGNAVVDEFASCSGRPQVKITTKDGLISKVKVLRGAPCGSTQHMAKSLVGSDVKDAPARAGLLVQQYPCRAQRGIKGGIHKAAQLHKNAVEKALRDINDERQGI